MKECFIPGVGGSENVVTMQIEQCEGMHDYITLRVRALQWERYLYSGQPIAVRWARKKWPTEDAFGYIDAWERGSKMLDVSVYGATWPLKSRGWRVWSQASIGSIARELVAPHRLNVEADGGRYTLSATQAGASDWEFLVRSAAEYGYSVVSDKTTVRIIDREKVLRQSPLRMPVLRPSYFTPTDGTSEGVPASYEVSGVDLRTLATYRATSQDQAWRPVGKFVKKPVVSIPLTGKASDGYTEAAELARAESLGKRWNVRASATMFGDVRVKPGIAVIVVGRDRYDGAWYVESVVHRLGARYMMDVQLCRDAVDDEAWNDRPLRPVMPLEDAERNRPPTRFMGERWVSEYRSA